MVSGKQLAVRSRRFQTPNNQQPNMSEETIETFSTYAIYPVSDIYRPFSSNAIKLRKIGDDCCGFKVHRFEGSKVLSWAHSSLTLSEYVRGLRTLRTFSNLSR